MLDLIYLVKFRHQARQCTTVAAPPSRPSALPTTTHTERAVAPVADTAIRPTCRCGRYAIEPFAATTWSIGPSSGELQSCGRVERLGRVTPRELELWRYGLQSVCSDAACSAFPHVEMHGNATLIPDGAQAPVAAAHADPCAEPRRMARVSRSKTC
jgi:hypothetical protein